MSANLQLIRHETEAAVTLTPSLAPTATVIWLHGLGADGHDFVPLVPELQLPASLLVRFVFPHAPLRPVTLNNGYVMRAWYDIKGLALQSEQDAVGIHASAQLVQQLVQVEVAAGIATQRIVIAGFSQGGAIALHTALRYPQRLAGVLALSTYLPLHTTLTAEASDANRDVPILMCHGRQDAVVPPQLGQLSLNLLQTTGYSVDFRSYDMPHSVCHEEVRDISNWLARVLA